MVRDRRHRRRERSARWSRAGARRAVVVRAIRDADDPEAAARRLRAALDPEPWALASEPMASRERKRAERHKRKDRSTERRAEQAAKRERMAARTEAKNEAARAGSSRWPRASARPWSRSAP